jgi:hypothetical protein
MSALGQAHGTEVALYTRNSKLERVTMAKCTVVPGRVGHH